MTVSKKQPRPQTPVLRSGQVRIKGQGSLSCWVWRARSVVLTEQALVTPTYKIPLSHISKLERVDSKPYCLLLEAKDRRYHLSFNNDGELYDWQEDVYSRSPLGGGQPFGFIHNIHVGVDGTSGAFSGLPPQWSEALKAHHLSAGVPPPVTSEDEKADLHQRRRSEVPPSPASLHGAPTLPYKSTRSRRASEPAPRSNSPTILDGKHSFREEGGLTSWMWKPRWLALTARTLMVSKSQHARGGISIKLQDITSIERDDTRACCLVLETSLHKRYLLSFDTDNELYNWQDAIYSRSGLAGISNPVNFMHNIHIGIDGVSGDFTGVPEQWKPLLAAT